MHDVTMIRSIVRQAVSEAVTDVGRRIVERGERDTPGRMKHDSRPNRTSMRKRLGEPTARAIEARDGHRCAYCRRTKEQVEAAGSYMSFDHLMPRYDGGVDDPKNLVYSCGRCNSSRQNRPLKQWVTYAAENLGVKVDLDRIKATARRKITPIYARDLAAA